jgi:hypothetical protein
MFEHRLAPTAAGGFAIVRHVGQQQDCETARGRSAEREWEASLRGPADWGCSLEIEARLTFRLGTSLAVPKSEISNPTVPRVVKK